MYVCAVGGGGGGGTHHISVGSDVQTREVFYFQGLCGTGCVEEGVGASK